MTKLKYILLIILISFFWQSTEALSINYGTIIGSKDSDVLVQYFGIEKKQNYLCSVFTRKCNPTKKSTLNINNQPLKLKKEITDELKSKNATHITLSPSGTLIAYYIRGTDENPTRSFMLRDLKTDKEYSISDSVSYWDLVNDESRVFAFSPDSQKLIYIDDKDGSLSLYLINTTKLSNENITSVKLLTPTQQVDDFIFTDNQILYFIGNTKENPYAWSLYQYNTKTSKTEYIASNVSYSNSLRHVGKSLIFNQLQAKGYGPTIYNLSTKKIQQFSIPGINTKSKIANEEIIQTGIVKGVLMTPTKNDKAKTYPLVIWLHGGPYRQASLEYHPYHSYGLYDSILELLRKNNILVLKLDYPGSYGHGRVYAESIKEGVGKIDTDNVMVSIDYIKNRYKIDDVYLAGNSYGGYMALRVLAENPEEFKGVMSINGVTDWESLLEKIKTSIFNTHFNGLPNENNQDLYEQASIVNKISNMGNQKISIIAGESDRTIPVSQSISLYENLKTQNKNVSLTTYKGEDHVFKKKETMNDLCKKMFVFVGITIDKECNK